MSFSSEYNLIEAHQHTVVYSNDISCVLPYITSLPPYISSENPYISSVPPYISSSATPNINTTGSLNNTFTCKKGLYSDCKPKLFTGSFI